MMRVILQKDRGSKMVFGKCRFLPDSSLTETKLVDNGSGRTGMEKWSYRKKLQYLHRNTNKALMKEFQAHKN